MKTTHALRHAALLSALALGAAWLLSSCASAAPATSPTASPSPTVEAQGELDDRPLETQLGDAIRDGDVSLVTELISAGADVNADLGAGTNALAVAVLRDDAGMVQVLIDAGADIEATDRSGNTALLVAAANAGPEVVAVLVVAGSSFDVAARDSANATPLHAATRARNVGALRAMLELGAPVDMTNLRYEATALHGAAFWDCVECAELLILAGADINALEVNGQTPLEIARGERHPDVVAFLESVGAAG